MAIKKLCFVTVGATAVFDDLSNAVLQPGFLLALQNQGYTDLQIQYGVGNEVANRLASLAAATKNIKVSGFDLDRNGLDRYMREAAGSTKDSTPGVVISHAGSGTILDALRLGAPLVVVPNTTLLDNHQVELAEALAEQGYVIHGNIGRLDEAIAKAEILAKQAKQFPPVNSGEHRQSRGLKGVLDEEMGFLD